MGTFGTLGQLSGMLSLATAYAGCYYAAEPLPAATPEALPTHTAAHDVAAGAESYFTKEKAALVLDEEDVVKGFMPVLVAARNDTEGFVMLDIGATSLVSSDGKVTHAMSAGDAYAQVKIDPNAISANGTTAAVAGGMAGAGVLAVVAAKAREKNDEMFTDWTAKELSAYIIGKGESRCGLLFFTRNKGAPPYSVLLAFENRAQKESFKLTLPLR